MDGLSDAYAEWWSSSGRMVPPVDWLYDSSSGSGGGGDKHPGQRREMARESEESGEGWISLIDSCNSSELLGGERTEGVDCGAYSEGAGQDRGDQPGGHRGFSGTSVKWRFGCVRCGLSEGGRYAR